MGHAAADVWSYTPRQIAAFHHFAHRRRQFERADKLALETLAARGDGKEVERQHRELSYDG